MKVGEAKIGELLIRHDREWLVCRISKNEFFVLKSPIHWGENGEIKELAYFSSDYVVCSIYDLSSKELEMYNTKVLPLLGLNKTQQGCTCDISNLMIQGCTCGWIAVERKR